MDIASCGEMNLEIGIDSHKKHGHIASSLEGCNGQDPSSHHS